MFVAVSTSMVSKVLDLVKVVGSSEEIGRRVNDK